ncbi:MAG TPA: signal recognition particle receptor subunit alpha, partial [Acidimicrobiales bacterium]|nr:signal recognition particle receptor subunit alpha [Acidimicrobiales bacterium]
MLFRRNREVEASTAEAQGDRDDSGSDPLGTDPNGSVGETDLFEDEEIEDDAVERTRRSRFGRSRGVLRTPRLGLRRRQRVDEKTLDELEEGLILADVGLSTTQFLLGQLRAKLRTKELSGDFEEMIRDLEASIIALFDGEDRELHRSHLRTTVWLFVGVNGVGK